MALPKQIVQYHNTKENMILELREDTDKILDAIDMDALLENPSNYLSLLGTAFLDKQDNKFKKAFRVISLCNIPFGVYKILS